MSAKIQHILAAVGRLSEQERCELLEAIQSIPPANNRPEASSPVSSIRGKYAHVETSSEQFNLRKQEEIALEH